MPHIGSDGHPQKQIMLLGSHAAGVGWSILCPLERPPTPSPPLPPQSGNDRSAAIPPRTATVFAQFFISFSKAKCIIPSLIFRYFSFFLILCSYNRPKLISTIHFYTVPKVIQNLAHFVSTVPVV